MEHFRLNAFTDIPEFSDISNAHDMELHQTVLKSRWASIEAQKSKVMIFFWDENERKWK